MSPGRDRRSRGERGYSLVALLAASTIMLIVMAAAVPAWQYVVRDDREEELIFRGGQIADAIRRYQQKNANTLPTSLDQLVKGRFLRRAYKEPFAKNGEWRLIRQGEPITPVPSPSASPRPGGPTPSPTPLTAPSAARPTPLAPVPGGQTGPLGAAGTGGVGAIVGVASRNAEKGLRLFNGRQRYNEWLFIAGQPRVVGRVPVTPAGAPGQPVRPGQPGGPVRVP